MRAGRRSRSEYDPKPLLMGETYVELPKLWAYAQHLDLVQNFPFLKAELDVEELRPIVELVEAKLPANATRCGSARTTTIHVSRRAGPEATSGRRAPRSSCC